MTRIVSALRWLDGSFPAVLAQPGRIERRLVSVIDLSASALTDRRQSLFVAVDLLR